MSKSNSNKFYDPLTNMFVSKSNIEAWNKKLKYTHSAPNHFLENIDIVFDKKEKIDVIRLVLNKNKDKFMAYLQYYNYKKLTKDTYTPDSLIREIDDLILKNRLYGLYSDDLMVGFLIVRKSRYFKIDNMSDKVDTFYIQEVYIDKSMRGRKLGKILLDYALLICPINKKYVSLMTYEGNIMANIAVSYGFELQNEESECPVNKLFFIRKMTDNDFIKNSNRITKSSY